MKKSNKIQLKIAEIMKSFREGTLVYKGKTVTTRDEAKQVVINKTKIK